LAEFLGLHVKREPTPRNWRAAEKRSGPWRKLPSYTSSIDAAYDFADQLTPIGPMVAHELVHSLARDGEEFWNFRIKHYSAEEGEAPTIFWATGRSASLAIILAVLRALSSQEASK
jgi:hypothetical protein